MDNIAFTVNMWEIYMANILKIVHLKKSTTSLTLTVLLFYETIQELRILDPLTLAQVSYLWYQYIVELQHIFICEWQHTF